MMISKELTKHMYKQGEDIQERGLNFSNHFEFRILHSVWMVDVSRDSETR